MLNCFNNNCCYLYILIILLLCCQGGCVRGLFDKICGCECLLPILIVLLLCGCGQKRPPVNGGNNFGGCGCK